MIGEISLATPTLLFSAASLILLAYSNRFMSYAQVIRNLHQEFKQNPSEHLKGQIKNLRLRLYLTRWMQLLGILSLFACTIAMFLIYINVHEIAAYTFGVGLLLIIASLALSVWEIQISVKALDLHLKDIEQDRQTEE